MFGRREHYFVHYMDNTVTCIYTGNYLGAPDIDLPIPLFDRNILVVGLSQSLELFQKVLGIVARGYMVLKDIGQGLFVPGFQQSFHGTWGKASKASFVGANTIRGPALTKAFSRPAACTAATRVV